MSDFDTMRWGDFQTIPLVQLQVNTDSTANFGATKQLLNVKWQRPLLWKLMLSIVPVLDATDSGADLIIEVLPTLYNGVGQANAQIPFPLQSFDSTSTPPYAPFLGFFDIPSEAMQMQFQLATSALVPATSTSYVQMSAFVAPVTEPRVIADIRDMMMSALGRDLPRRAEPGSDANPRWMTPPFDDGVTRYRG